MLANRLTLQLAGLLVAVGTLAMTRLEPATGEQTSWQATTATPAWLEKATWGPLQGLGADFAILKVFSIYYDGTHVKQADNAVWHAMKRTLYRAHDLDPLFIDTYHMGVITLAYDAKMPKEAVRLAELGGEAMPHNWQIPFTGGFIAYDVLQDYRTASRLMLRAANTPEMPVLAVGLAARFMAKDTGPEDGIAFLKGMLHVLPEQYHHGIHERIKELSQSVNKPERK